MGYKNLHLLTILALLLLFATTVFAESKPLAGKWEQKDDGSVLHLKNDGIFSWGELKGKWFLEEKSLFLHTPGKLNGYKFQLKGKSLFLSGGSFVSGTHEFVYKSKGNPLSPGVTSEAQIQSFAEVIVDDSSSTSPSQRAREKVYQNPLCGVWRAIEPIGREDTLIFNASGRYDWDRDNKGIFKVQGDRVYLNHGTENEEYYYLIENPFLVIGFHKDYLPRLYIQMDMPVSPSAVRDFEQFNGKFYTDASVRAEDRGFLHTKGNGTEHFTIDSYGRIEGWIADAANDTTYTWGGYAYPYGSSMEIRFDSGDLKSFDISYEYDPKIGKIIELNGNLYLENIDAVYKIDTAERMEPYEASSLRRILSELMRDANIEYRQLPFEN